jgi:hypothetical protein
MLVLASVVLAMLAASATCAATFDGVARVVAIVVAVISGLYAAAMLIPLLLIFGAIFVAKGLLAKNPSNAQRASWGVAALLLGAVLGLGTYGVGAPGLLTGPLVIAAFIAVLGTRESISRRTRRRSLALALIVGVAALATGVTVFL